MRERTGRRGTEEPHHWHRRLLRARRERPCDRRTGEQRDELTALHAQQHDGSSCRSLLASDQKGSTSRCGRTLLHCGISIPAMSVEGHFRQINPLPTLSACPLRSDRVRTFAPQRIDEAPFGRPRSWIESQQDRNYERSRGIWTNLFGGSKKNSEENSEENSEK